MKKQLITAVFLLLVTTTVTFAQMGEIVQGAGTGGGNSNPPSTITGERACGRGFKLPVGGKLTAGPSDHGASLHLRSDALVMEIHKTEMSGDEFVPRTTESWSIPFNTPARELEFTPQGELIVRGQNNQILFNAYPDRPGEWLKITPDGTLKIDAKDGKGNLYILWKK